MNESQDMRALVLSVLREMQADGTGSPFGANGQGVRVEAAVIASDADLDAFARRLAAACADSEYREQVHSGKVRFALASPRPGTSPNGQIGSAAMRIDKGAVTERHVREASKTSRRLQLGKRAVLTPLARDAARTLGVEVVKEP